MPRTERAATSPSARLPSMNSTLGIVARFDRLPVIVIVDDADGFAATSQFLTQVRADETGAAGDEIVSHVNSALIQLSRARADNR